MDEPVEDQEAVEASPGDDALFSLISGEGDGFMLGVAAGDAAGGAWDLGYSAITEQVCVLAYEMIENRDFDAGRIVPALRDLDGSQDEERVYRAETGHFRAWLDGAAAGAAHPLEDPSTDVLARAVVAGVGFRKDVSQVTRQVLQLTRIFDISSASLEAALISAAAAAASCYAQSGRDLVFSVAETVRGVESPPPALSPADLLALSATISALADHIGVDDGEEALSLAGGDREDPVHLAMAGLLLAAPVRERFHMPVEQAARIGGSSLGAYVGGIVGARVGIRGWPWAFANDTWFAEIGRRVVRGPDEVRDLPIPYAVEQHLMFGSRPGLHR